MIILFSKKSFAALGAAALAAALFFMLLPRKERIIPTAPAVPTAKISPQSSPAASEAPSPSLPVSATPELPQNPLTGERCMNALRRPMAVMLSGDAIARPLSGIGEADMVFEMPVITGSITRFMAVFVCRDAIEIGSVRSARHDFIPIARGLDAVYAHWGGSHFALNALKKHAINNIDALPNPTGAYWRKDSAPAPHNGFTSMTRLLKAARFLQYRLEGQTPAYPHVAESATSTLDMRGTLEIGYAGSFRVRYEYDPFSKRYTRVRGGITERDRNSNEPVVVRNIVVLRAVSRQIEGQYNDVALEGKGDCAVYRGGVEIPCAWRKDAKNTASKLEFVDVAGAEIPFLPGNIWVEIVEPYTDVRWTTAG